MGVGTSSIFLAGSVLEFGLQFPDPVLEVRIPDDVLPGGWATSPVLRSPTG